MAVEGWKEATLIDVCEILDSKRIPLNSDERNQRKGNIPYWGANGVVDYIDDHIFDEPLLLMAEDGGYFDQASTRPICHLVDGPAWVNNHAHVMRVKNGTLRGWVYYWFVHRDITHYINGGTRTKLNQKDLRSLPIELPPLSEQKKITEILESVDDAIAKTEAVIAQTQRVKQGLLQQLLTRGIGHTKFKQTDLGEIPEGWECKNLGVLCSEMKYGTSEKSSSHEGKYPVLRIPNVVSRQIDLQDLKYSNLEQKEVKKYSLNENDILVIRTNGNPEYVGRTAIVCKEFEGYLYASYLIKIRTIQDILLPQYLHLNAEYGTVKSSFDREKKTSAGNYNINTDGMRSAMIALPPIDEQKKIVQVAAEINTSLRNENFLLIELNVLKAGLMSELLTGRVRVNVDANPTTQTEVAA